MQQIHFTVLGLMLLLQCRLVNRLAQFWSDQDGKLLNLLVKDLDLPNRHLWVLFACFLHVQCLKFTFIGFAFDHSGDFGIPVVFVEKGLLKLSSCIFDPNWYLLVKLSASFVQHFIGLLYSGLHFFDSYIGLRHKLLLFVFKRIVLLALFFKYFHHVFIGFEGQVLVEAKNHLLELIIVRFEPCHHALEAGDWG